MSTDNSLLKPLRDEIDLIDLELLRLLNDRARCAIEIGGMKAEQLDDPEELVFYRPERVAKVLGRLVIENSGPLKEKDITTLFREIMSCCLSLEQLVRVGFLGPEGTYTEAAARKQFGRFVETQGLVSINGVFREVDSGSVNYGVVPVENSTEGMVNHTLDCFVKSDLKICAEIELPIHHCFLRSPAGKAEITEIVSHSQSLAQCRSWLDSHYPDVPRRAVSSNAEAARLITSDARLGAVAGEMAAEKYDLTIVASNIEDNPNNKTRFLVIGKQNADESESDKTSILVSVKNKPGALHEILEPFRLLNIGLSRIETRPSGSGDWSYLFFIDFDGHQKGKNVGEALLKVEELALNLKVLGSYPKAI